MYFMCRDRPTKKKLSCQNNVPHKALFVPSGCETAHEYSLNEVEMIHSGAGSNMCDKTRKRKRKTSAMDYEQELCAFILCRSTRSPITLGSICMPCIRLI